MSTATTVRGGCKDLCAIAASLGLVTASAGFGATYAWQNSTPHGLLLASLAVLMALSLEIAKPLAVVGALDAARRWEAGRATGLLLLGSIAIAYSLTAELSLMARTRADATAERASESRKSFDARERVAALRAEIARHDSAEVPQSASPLPAPSCSGEWLSNSRARAACLEQARLHAKALETQVDLMRQQQEGMAIRTADRRALVERLEAAERDAAEAGPERVADPGAQALAGLLSALGLSVPVDRLAEGMVLVGVLALEVGSALSGLLGGCPARLRRQGEGDPRYGHETLDAGIAPQVPHRPVLALPPVRGSDTARERVLALVAASGGSLEGGQRALAERLGVSRARLRQVLTVLEHDGRIRVRANSSGTAIELPSPR